MEPISFSLGLLTGGIAGIILTVVVIIVFVTAVIYRLPTEEG